MKANNQFEQFVVDKLMRLDEVLTEHNAQTAELAKDVSDLKKHKWLLYGAVGMISITGSILGVLKFIK